MKRLIAFSFCLIVALNSFVLSIHAVKIDGKASPNEGWAEAYSSLLVDSVSESCNQINYARAFATSEGDYLYLKLDAIDGAAPDGTSPEGIEISTGGALFTCFFDESVSSDYDRNLYSFEYVMGRSIDGFDAEMCIVYKDGLPDNVSLTFVLTDNTGEKSARLPFNYTVPEKEESALTAKQPAEIKSEKTTLKTENTTKNITTTARTTTARPKSETQPSVIETSASTTKARTGTTAVTTKKTVSKKAEATPQTPETQQENTTSEKPSTVVSSTVQTINAGAAINFGQAQAFKKKKVLAMCGCTVAIITACVAGTVNFKKHKKNDNNE